MTTTSAVAVTRPDNSGPGLVGRDKLGDTSGIRIGHRALTVLVGRRCRGPVAGDGGVCGVAAGNHWDDTPPRSACGR